MSSSDPLEDVLRLLKIESVLSASFVSRRPWSISFPAYPHIKFGTLVAGECWLAVEGEREPTLVERGDYYLMSNAAPYRMASDLALAPEPSGPVFAAAGEGGVKLGPPDGPLASRIIGGHFALDPSHAALLIDSLPTITVIKAGTDGSGGLTKLLDVLIAEVNTASPGRSMVLDWVTQALMVLALRERTGIGELAPGWLGALADPPIREVLKYMHADIRRRWTLEDLAELAGMSRSSLSARFSRAVGTSPLDYLIGWRIRLAKEALRKRRVPMSSLAFELGYESESAFSTAFSRVVGISPSRYRADNFGDHA